LEALVGVLQQPNALRKVSEQNGKVQPRRQYNVLQVLKWLRGVQEQLGENPSREQLEKYIWDTLKSGKVVPGYGHAVLRRTDPRYMCQREFALQYVTLHLMRVYAFNAHLPADLCPWNKPPVVLRHAYSVTYASTSKGM
jgi:hypothetical protein